MDPLTFLSAFGAILAVFAILSVAFGVDSRGWEDPRPWWPGYGETRD
jgi:hypothetical protein